MSNPLLPDPTAPTISQLLTTLKRTTLSIHNRLTSIRADAAFVSRAAASLQTSSDGNKSDDQHGEVRNGVKDQKRRRRQRPLIANERCGSWYVPPAVKGGSAYFKSTDGHERAWKFSTRRLNLHLVDLIEEFDGVIIVDSTRRGKRMPDALSTTIPIWCTVLNRALLPSNPLSQTLHLPPTMSPSTHAQITALIPTFLSSLLALNLSLPTSLSKPLRPFWITQDSYLADPNDGDNGDDGRVFEDYRPVICCTASRRVVGSEIDEGGYVQGAGDDTENWAHGLTPPVFWEHPEQLIDAVEVDLPGLIRQLVKQHRTESKERDARKQLTPHISVCALPLYSPPSPPSSDCHIVLLPEITKKETWVKSPTRMEIGLGKSKAGSRGLRLALPVICDFVAKFMGEQEAQDASVPKIIAACDSGKDLSVGTALALACYLFDADDGFRLPDRDTTFTKTIVKAKLGHIMTVYPDANPSRSTLQSVNSFLMDWQR